MSNGFLRAAGLAFLFFALALPLLGTERQSPSLQQSAERIVAGTGGEWGVMVWSITTGQTLVSVNAEKPLIPASNNKVVTAIWALDELGPDYRFPTDLLMTGPIEDGVLQGDLVLRGSGDPAFGYPPRLGHSIFIEEPMTPLHTMARRLAERGVRVVEGGVIGDATAFDSVLVGPSWPNDTGAGAAQYAPRVSGLPFQRNMVWVEASVVPGSGTPQVQVYPPVEVVPVLANVRVGSGRALAVRRPNDDTIRVSGAIAGRGPHRYGVGVRNPAIVTADALRQALTEAGIQVMGGARTGRTPEDAVLIHQHFSMPLGLMIPFLNQSSDNFFAEHLWKASAHAALGEGSYPRGGPASALHFIEKAGVQAGELYQFDGSGLSSLTRMSPRALVQSLAYAHAQPYSELWHRSMAVAADPGGTMSRLYRGTPAAGNLHAKTGFIRNVRTLSGYVEAGNGELLAFSFLYNGSNTNGARSAQEQLGVLLASSGGR